MYSKGYHDINTADFPFFSTDLAVEAHERYSQDGEIAGIDKEVEENDNVKIERIFVRDMQAGQAINKVPGNYVTIYAPGLRSKDTPLRQQISKLFAKEFSKYIKDLNEQDSILIVGLGNMNATPDAIGPSVTEKLIISRHFFQVMPDKVEKGFRPISAISPGVMGQTGIETGDIVQGVIKEIKPDLLIVIDALASRSIERINTTIQIADTGINPGAGVGNARKALNKDTLGIPVIAIGVPTVVDAVTIVHDALEYVTEYLNDNGNIANQLAMPNLATKNMIRKQALNPQVNNQQIYNQQTNDSNVFHNKYEKLSEQQKKHLIFQVLKAEGHQFMVTPKEIDTYIEDMANIIAGGLNAALHPKISIEDAAMYTQ
jgi:spore protease